MKSTSAIIFDTEEIRPEWIEQDASCYTLNQATQDSRVEFFETSEEKRREISERTMAELLGFADKEVNGKSVRQWLQFDQTSLWYYHKFRLYIDIRNLYYKVSAVLDLATQYESLSLYSSRDVFTRIPFFPDHVNIKKVPGRKKKTNWGKITAFVFMVVWRWLNSTGVARRSKDAEFLIMNRPVNEVPMLMPDSLEIKQENYYYGYLLPIIDKRFLVLEEIDHPKLKGDDKFRFLKRFFRPRKDHNSIGTDSILLNGILRSGVRSEVQEAHQQLQSNYIHLEEAADTMEEKVIAWFIRQFHSSVRFYLYRYYSAKRWLQKGNWKIWMAVDENSPAIRMYADAAKALGIKTVAIQHGTIHPLHMAYRFTPGDMKEFMPVPDLTFVWGKHWQGILRDYGHYPDRRLVVSGQPRADIIPHLKAIPRSKVLPVLKDDQPLIVFASQPLRDKELREKIARDVFLMAKEIPGLQLVVKMHPLEPEESYYRNIAQDVGYEPIITKEVDLFQIIAVSEALITCSSTVGAETVYFGKPLIILDHLEQDLMGYINAGVGMKAINSHTLLELTQSVLSGKKVIDQEAYDQFQGSYAYQGNIPIAGFILEALEAM